MGWLPAGWYWSGWVYWAALGCEPVPRTGSGSVPDLTAIDLWMIELTYGFVAAESRCTRCGTPLGRGLRVTPSVTTHSPWIVSILTRCRGWRRHRHVATVVEASNDLALGPFLAD